MSNACPIPGGFVPVNLAVIADPEALELLEQVLSRLAAYAGHKAHGLRLRVAGNVELALANERICEALYLVLPAWARWPSAGLEGSAQP